MVGEREREDKKWKHLIDLAEKVEKHGWGGVELKITQDGKRKAYKWWFTDEEEGNSNEIRIER